MTTPPLGYSVNKVPESIYDTYDTQIVDKAVSITKSAVQNVMEQFFSPTGVYRNYLKSSISPEGLQYVTTLTYDEDMKVNANLRKLHIAKYFAENTGARKPSIFIIDQGFDHVDAGINELVEGRMYQGQWQGRLTFLGKISLSLSVATYSEEETNVLSTLVLFIWGSLIQIINNGIIHEPGKHWEIRAPLSGITAGQITSTPVEGDTKNQVWMRNVDIPFDFETVISLQLPIPRIVPPAIGVVNGHFPEIPRFQNLVANQAVRLGEPYPLFIEHMVPGYRLATSDPNIALVTGTAPFLLQPVRQGRVVIYVNNSQGTPGQDPVTGKKLSFITDIPIRITL